MYHCEIQRRRDCRYSGKNEIARSGSRRLYHIPEADALGLENRAEASKIKYEQDCKRMNRSLNRFRRIADQSEKAAHGRDIGFG